jgi:hypothetical protein
MAWEWSFSEEGYSTIYENIHKMSREDLIVCLAEFAMYEHGGETEQDDLDEYTRKQLDLEVGPFVQETLADLVWDKASSWDYRTCDNGGHFAWVCPYGCHKVPLDLEEIEQ